MSREFSNSLGGDETSARAFSKYTPVSIFYLFDWGFCSLKAIDRNVNKSGSMGWDLVIALKDDDFKVMLRGQLTINQTDRFIIDFCT